MQNKIDRLISNGNSEFSDQRNVISALVEYSRCLDLFDLLDRSYKVQLHEVLVRIAICFDILGNFQKTLDYLNRALTIVPNAGSLILYKSVLLQTLGKTEEAQKILIKFKQISGKKQMDLYETFRLVFYYSMQLEKDVLLREINEFLEKYPKNAVVLYLRAMIFLDLSTNNKGTSSNHKKHQGSDYMLKHEKDLKEAMSIEPHDTEFLIKDGITNENLTKLFFMIIPEMDYYQPRSLVNYSTFHCGLRLFYVLFKAVKILKIKLEKKRLKHYYNNKLKLYKRKSEAKGVSDNSDNSNINSYSNTNTNSSLINPQNNSEGGGKDSSGNNTSDKISSGDGSVSVATTNNQSRTIASTTNSDLGENSLKDSNSPNLNSYGRLKKMKGKTINTGNQNFFTERNPMQSLTSVINQNQKTSKSPTIVNIKNNVEKANIEEVINEIKKEYESKVKALYNSVWLANIKYNDINNYNLYDVDLDSNYFIKNKYYAHFNLKETLISAVKMNIEYKNNTQRNNTIANCINSEKDKVSVSPSALKIETNGTKNSRNLNMVFNSNNINQSNKDFLKPIPFILNKKSEENIIEDFGVSEINYKHTNHQDPDSMSISSDINLLDNNFQNSKSREDSIKNNNNIKKIEKEKLTTEMIKNEVLNTKKFIHKPSPRMEFFKLNSLNNKYTSFSKEKKIEVESVHAVSKGKIYLILSSDDITNPNVNTNNNSNNLTNNSNINKLTDKSDIPLNKNNQSNTSNNTNNTNNTNLTADAPKQISLRKSLEFGKIKLNDEIIKNKAPGNSKPMLFKNLTKNMSNKLAFLNQKSNIKNDSGCSSNGNKNENNY